MNVYILKIFCFNDGVNEMYSMDAGMEIHIISLCYNIILGCCDKLRRIPYIITPIDGMDVDVEFVYDTLPLPISNLMIVYIEIIL